VETRTQAENGEEAIFEVIDALGRSMEVKGELKQNTILDTSNWHTGLYRVKIISISGIETQGLQIIK
jgi:hypothetical protein